MRGDIGLPDFDLVEMVAQARKALADEKWVKWALDESADGNEGALVYAYTAIVRLADARGPQASEEES